MSKHDPIEALAASMFEDDLAPLRWSRASEQQKQTYTDTAIQAATAYNRLLGIRVDAFLVRCRQGVEQ
jgi:hypothetical protein